MLFRSWLEDYADVFGIQQAETQATPNVDPAQMAAYKRMNVATQQAATPDAGGDIMRRLLNANSREELDQVIRESGL